MFSGLASKQKRNAVISMTSTEVEKLIREALTASGLWQVVDQHKSQFLEFPDGFFAEVVLNDGSKLVEAEGVARQIEESLRKQGTELDVIVRANWIVKEIANPPYGNQLGVWRIPVILASGAETRAVEVDVQYDVVLDIKNRIAEKTLDETSVVKEVVREFIEMELSLGGESYWDPIRYPRREINGSALSYLFLHTPVAQNLGIRR
jgi:hypothetical protein